MLFKKVLSAFTIAEVLIVLGIIGIVAELTLPTLYQGYQKQITLTKLQKFYTIMAQVVKQSEIVNGTTSGWTYGGVNTTAGAKTFFDTYLAPYIRKSQDITCTYAPTTDYCFSLSDGSVLDIYVSGSDVEMAVMFNGMPANTSIKNADLGKNIFFFQILRNPTTNIHFQPFAYYDISSGGSSYVGTRSYWTTSARACTSATAYKYECAGLIMYDNWQIKNDYPFFN